MALFLSVVDALADPLANKGLAASNAERLKNHTAGLIPAGQLSIDVQTERAMQELRRKGRPLEKYIFMQTMQDTNETLYYRMLVQHTAELLPIVYTPVVGQACQEFHLIYRQTCRGVYLSLEDKGRVREMLSNHPLKDIRAIVFTDGERILGLGDLGVNGMGIPIGKLALYTTCAGIDPSYCLPVHLDMGCNRKELVSHPYYMGLKRERCSAADVDDFVGEFMTAAQDLYGKSVLLQFEDFGNADAFRLLHDWQDNACTFNDDIQGTASVVLAGLLAGMPLTGIKSIDHTFLFLGAGEAGCGCAELIALALSKECNIPIAEARKKIWLVDSKGLVVQARHAQLAHHKRPFAHEHPKVSNLMEAVKVLNPTCLIGLSTVPGSFNEEVCRYMARINKRPIIFALSNPTSMAECTAEEAYTWTEGRCLFASGSPFDPVELNGRTFVPGQGNNAYIFPGIGLGITATKALRVTDEHMYIAAKALAAQVTEQDTDTGCLYPPLSNIREVSAQIAAAVAEDCFRNGFATVGRPTADLVTFCKSHMYTPTY